jgi:hypothetical protein
VARRSGVHNFGRVKTAAGGAFSAALLPHRHARSTAPAGRSASGREPAGAPQRKPRWICEPVRRRQKSDPVVI